jgi:hypothetical protein
MKSCFTCKWAKMEWGTTPTIQNGEVIDPGQEAQAICTNELVPVHLWEYKDINEENLPALCGKYEALEQFQLLKRVIEGGKND